ncbi:hypothetical protein VNO77_22664 [Canavalia gladiata]|uniref:Uncharacterized protein n=1 Tax=Canavalia gladiata TaxID=3824 RepID=A0AAN9L891_CANGL
MKFQSELSLNNGISLAELLKKKKNPLRSSLGFFGVFKKQFQFSRKRKPGPPIGLVGISKKEISRESNTEVLCAHTRSWNFISSLGPPIGCLGIWEKEISRESNTKVLRVHTKSCARISLKNPNLISTLGNIMQLPPGYISLECVVSRTDEAPRMDLFGCPRIGLVSQANIHEMPLLRFSSSRNSQCWSIWKVENQACTFLVRSDLKKPSS